MNLKEFFIKNRETLQLAYGVILIILIPVLIASNTIFIINKYNKNLDVALQRQALMVGRSIYALIKDDLNDEVRLQEKIETLLEKNVEFQDLSVLIPDNDNFRIIASSKSEDINKILDFYYYKIAWMQPDNDGLATDSFQLASTPESEKIIENFSSTNRFWQVTLPMKNSQGVKQALLTMKLSSEIVDDLTNYNRNASVFLLIITVLIVILFLGIAVRLWDYALLYKKIKEVDQMKDEFISIASHELRTPVTGIKGYASMILDGSFGEVNDKVKNNLKIIKSASERLASLVEDLLNVSRIEQGRMKIEGKPQDINPIIKEIVAELTTQAKEKNLELKYQPHTEKFPLINIDSDRFKQVLINIIGNGIKYTEKGQVEIITSDKKGKFLEIKIKDTGIGMSAKSRERLFQKFYRVQNEKTKNVTGTGLGLWITKKIVELMKGTIMVDSMEGAGTEITLQFPIVHPVRNSNRVKG